MKLRSTREGRQKGSQVQFAKYLVAGALAAGCGDSTSDIYIPIPPQRGEVANTGGNSSAGGNSSSGVGGNVSGGNSSSGGNHSGGNNSGGNSAGNTSGGTSGSGSTTSGGMAGETSGGSSQGGNSSGGSSANGGTTSGGSSQAGNTSIGGNPSGGVSSAGQAGESSGGTTSGGEGGFGGSAGVAGSGASSQGGSSAGGGNTSSGGNANTGGVGGTTGTGGSGGTIITSSCDTHDQSEYVLLEAQGNGREIGGYGFFYLGTTAEGFAEYEITCAQDVILSPLVVENFEMVVDGNTTISITNHSNSDSLARATIVVDVDESAGAGGAAGAGGQGGSGGTFSPRCEGANTAEDYVFAYYNQAFEVGGYEFLITGRTDNFVSVDISCSFDSVPIATGKLIEVGRFEYVESPEDSLRINMNPHAASDRLVRVTVDINNL